MSDLGDYDQNAAPAEVYDPVPRGWYVVQIEESDVKDTSKNDGGKRLSLKVRILEGEYEKRIVFHGVNIKNANPKAQEIGQRELASIRKATGVNAPRASEELHNIPFRALIAIQAARVVDGKSYEARNEIKGYMHMDEKPPGSASASPAVTAQKPSVAANQPVQQSAPATPTATQPPWKR